MAKNIRIDGLEWEDIQDWVINSIALNGVNYSTNSTSNYFFFNVWTLSWWNNASAYGDTFFWHLWQNGTQFFRVPNLTNIVGYGASDQPILHSTYTSTNVSAIEWAWWTTDASTHVLSKMWIFIK